MKFALKIFKNAKIAKKEVREKYKYSKTKEVISNQLK